jgi:lambda family phage portal protein
MNIIDKALLPVFPRWVAARLRWRSVVASYDATKKTRTRNNRSDNSAADVLAQSSAVELRGQARQLEQNSDLVTGLLDTLVRNVIGPRGIGLESSPRKNNGDIDTALAEEIEALYVEFEKQPEVTRSFSGAKGDRLACRSWLRDGEVLNRHYMGAVPGLKHATAIPYSYEYLESDFLPFDSDEKRRIVQGVQKGKFGNPVSYHLLQEHPGASLSWRAQTVPVNAGEISHLRFQQRLHMTRGVSILAACVNRLNDIKDYEESERVAARVAATMVAYIRRGSDELWQTPVDDEGNAVTRRRLINFEPGMTFDDLDPGEDVGTIESNRPSPLLTDYLKTMYRMVASGTMSSFSSVTKNYDGTYSAQRQELVDQWGSYELLGAEFVEQIKSQQFDRFVRMAVLSGVLKVPEYIDRSTLVNAEFILPTMPWVDPQKEAKANEVLLQQGLESPQRIIRKRGAKPRDVIDQMKRWKQMMVDADLAEK